jgi:hypothetical protein
MVQSRRLLRKDYFAEQSTNVVIQFFGNFEKLVIVVRIVSNIVRMCQLLLENAGFNLA